MAGRQYWITPVNPETYRVFDAYATLPEIDWRLDAKPEVGDIVYILVSDPFNFVKYKTLVTSTGIEPEDKIDDSEFVIKKKGGKKSTENTKEGFTRLKLLATFPDDKVRNFELIFSEAEPNIKTQQLSESSIKNLSYSDQAPYFQRGCFSYLIDQCSKEKFPVSESTKISKPSKSSKSSKSSRTSKSSQAPHWEAVAENVRLVLPELVNGVRTLSSSLPYFDLIGILANSKQVVPIDDTMVVIHDVLMALSKETRQDIPTLNAMLTDLFTSLPKHKFDYVLEGYDGLGDEDKHKVIETYNAKARLYKNWAWVLSMLGLGHKVDIALIEKTRKERIWKKNECEEYEHLKELISEGALDVIIYSQFEGEIDYTLLSGDKVDVYFPDCNIAVIVKPATSTEEDIMRGIYQCVKIKAVLDAEFKYKGEFAQTQVILALGGALTDKTHEAAQILGVKVFEYVGDEEDEEDEEELW